MILTSKHPKYSQKLVPAQICSPQIPQVKNKQFNMSQHNHLYQNIQPVCPIEQCVAT